MSLVPADPVCKSQVDGPAPERMVTSGAAGRHTFQHKNLFLRFGEQWNREVS